VQPSEEQIKALLTTLACVACGSRYQQGGIEVLERSDTFWLLRVNCATCTQRGLVAALIRPLRAARPLPTRHARPALTSPQLDQPRVSGPITHGDVIRMRTFLKTFDGNFRRLFSRAENA
jgi:hypothetical protein